MARGTGGKLRLGPDRARRRVLAEHLRKATPRAALLSTLAGIALGFISLGFLFRTFAHPIVGLTTLAVVLLTYFGRVQFKGGLPGGLVAVTIGVGLSWATGLAPSGAAPGPAALALPLPALGDLWTALTGPDATTYASVILPMGLFNVLGSAQSFVATPAAHAPAVVVGLLPGVAAWGAMLAKNGLRAAGAGSPQGPAFSPALMEAFHATDTWIEGAFALEQGFIFSAMLLSAATVCLIERRFLQASAWCLVGAALSATGLIHAYGFTPADTRMLLKPAVPFALAYTAMAVVFALARFTTEPSSEDD